MVVNVADRLSCIPIMVTGESERRQVLMKKPPANNHFTQ